MTTRARKPKDILRPRAFENLLEASESGSLYIFATTEGDGFNIVARKGRESWTLGKWKGPDARLFKRVQTAFKWFTDRGIQLPEGDQSAMFAAYEAHRRQNKADWDTTMANLAKGNDPELLALLLDAQRGVTADGDIRELIIRETDALQKRADEAKEAADAVIQKARRQARRDLNAPAARRRAAAEKRNALKNDSA